MLIASNTIFYFSGTGNSLQVANDLKQTLVENHQLQAISEMMNHSVIEIHTECIGFVFPVYMFGIPLLVAEFLKKLSFKNKPYIFAVATCSGNVGQSFTQVNSFLNLQLQELNAEFTVKMPGNNILYYGAKPVDRQVQLFNKERVCVSQIASTIAARHNTNPTTVPLFIKIIAPIAYSKLERQYGNVPAFNTTSSCNGCGLCQRVCSVNNIHMIEKKPAWENHCQLCMACIQHCPKEAIQHGRKTIGRTRYQNPNVKILNQQ